MLGTFLEESEVLMLSKSPEDVLKFASEKNVQMVDLKFSDLLGNWHHLTIPLHQLKLESFKEGFAFDGSSFLGWKNVEDSDMLMLPDPSTALMDPFTKVPTLSLICDLYCPDKKALYEKDPRFVLKKAMSYLRDSGIADEAYFGPEAEFFIFDSIRFEQNCHSGFYLIDSSEGTWNTGRDEEGKNLGYKIRTKGGYFPTMPSDTLHDIRTEMCVELEKCGFIIERHHREVATAGQAEINFRFDSAVAMADKMMWFKYIVKNVAKRHGKTVTFMPKPLHGDNGSGMHIHTSLWKNDKNLFAGEEYAGLSETALHFIGGILKHAPALCALTNPTTNSYKRLVPGFEAPTRLAYSHRNRSAAIRIPTTADDPKAKRIEFRTPDGSANIYLAQAAILMAGIDGIENKIHPGNAFEGDLYKATSQSESVQTVPATLQESLEKLKANPEFLLKGEVFSPEILKTWIQHKMEREVLPMMQRPVPYEFYLYYDC